MKRFKIFSTDSADSFPSVNPASGLPMSGDCFDVAGNLYGFDYSTDCSSTSIFDDSFGSSSCFGFDD